MSAYTELKDYLDKDEKIEGVVFGDYGWSSEHESVPQEKRGTLLTEKQASTLMKDWSINGDYGSPDCYATYIWTNKRVIWVTQYDGATGLNSAPRNPTDCMPDMPGG